MLCAWKRFPESFSLTGDAHPDSNRVLAKLSGVDGLCGLGWLERTAPGTYRVAREGRRIATALPRDAATPMETPRATVVEVEVETAVTEAAAEATGAPPRASRGRKATVARAAAVVEAAPAKPEPLAPHEVLGVNLLAKSDAIRKFLRVSPLTFTDACAFWGVSRKRPTDAVPRAETTGALLTRVVESLGVEGPVDSKLPSLSTCYGLLNLHRLMASRFAKELEATRPTGGARAIANSRTRWTSKAALSPA